MSALVSGLLIGSIGGFLFLYGKNAQKYTHMGIGVAMCIYPYFISSQVLSWALTIVLLVPLYVYRHSL